MAQNIYAKLFNVQASCSALQKKAQGGVAGKFNFKYASLDQIQEQVNGYLAENKILLTFNFYNAELIDHIVKVECRAKFINAEITGEFVEIKFPFLIDRARGLNLIQTIGAAQTYARRYFLQNYFNLVTKEALDADPDKLKKESPVVVRRGKRKEQTPIKLSTKKKITAKITAEEPDQTPIQDEFNIKEKIDGYFQNDKLKFQWFNILKQSPNFTTNGYKWGQYSKKELKEFIQKMNEFESSEIPPSEEPSSELISESPTTSENSQLSEEEFENETDDSDDINWD